MATASGAKVAFVRFSPPFRRLAFRQEVCRHEDSLLSVGITDFRSIEERFGNGAIAVEKSGEHLALCVREEIIKRLACGIAQLLVKSIENVGELRSEITRKQEGFAVLRVDTGLYRSPTADSVQHALPLLLVFDDHHKSKVARHGLRRGECSLWPVERFRQANRQVVLIDLRASTMGGDDAVLFFLPYEDGPRSDVVAAVSEL